MDVSSGSSAPVSLRNGLSLQIARFILAISYDLFAKTTQEANRSESEIVGSRRGEEVCILRKANFWHKLAHEKFTGRL